MANPTFFPTESTYISTLAVDNNTNKAAGGLTIPIGARSAIVGIIIDEAESLIDITGFTFSDGSNTLTAISSSIGKGGRSSTPARTMLLNVYDITDSAATTSASVSCVHTSTTKNAQFFIAFCSGVLSHSISVGSYGDLYDFDFYSDNGSRESIMCVRTQDASQATDLSGLSGGDLQVLIEGAGLASANVNAVGASAASTLQEFFYTNTGGSVTANTATFLIFNDGAEPLTGGIPANIGTGVTEEYNSSTNLPSGRDFGTKRYQDDGDIIPNYIHTDFPDR